MLSPRLRAQSVFQYCNGNSLSAARSKTGPFSNYVSRTESRVNGQDNFGVGDDLSDQVAARSFIRGNRFSLSCFVDGLQLSEDHFHHPPNAHSAKSDDSTSVQFETFFHPENFLGHLTPPSVAGSE